MHGRDMLPALVPFNGWRQKRFMDNPDFLYWVADVRPGRRYRVHGTRGDAASLSLTAYAALTCDSGEWLQLPEGASAVWVRQARYEERFGLRS